MPLASLLREVLACGAPALFGLRQWLAATRHDPACFELDLVA